ncbi:sugar ABC transporter substrate-binding protein [Streptacidiphilus sp. MAP5-3]|uniref:ABC transporter substrate-binding protein n=1 Tax=unclassified Streptacidiphilus TaxID=2643834 RepID=UPI00351307C3
MHVLHGRIRLPALALALAALPASLGLSGCASSADPNTLIILNSATEPHEAADQQRLFDQCAGPLGLKVVQESVPADQVPSKALRMASSHSLPDILDLDGSDLPTFAAIGGLQPLKPLGVTFSDQSASALAMGSYQGTQYGIARAVDSLGLMYNTDLLEKAGIAPPTTWDELKRDAKLLTHGHTYGMAFSATPNADGVFQFLPFFWSAGGNEAHLGDGAGAPALQLWKDLVDDGSASGAVVTWNQQDINDQFVAGNAAMMINGPWQVPVLGSVRTLHWAVAPIPVPKAGDPVVPPLGGTVMTIPRTGDLAKEKAAAKVLDCLNTARNQLAWGESEYYIPTRADAAAQYEKDNPQLAGFVSEIPTARTRVERVGENWPTVETALGSAFQDVITGKSTPQQALQQAQAQVKAGS